MPNYYSNTTVMTNPFSLKDDVVVLADTLTGNGAHYRLTSVIVGNQMDTEINVLPYARQERCKFFQNKNISSMTLPFKVDKHSIKCVNSINENYTKEL